jgi:hypothetical protein
LVVAYRRQEVIEGADQHQREVAADNKHDLAERRITELYAKAVEQPTDPFPRGRRPTPAAGLGMGRFPPAAACLSSAPRRTGSL